MRRWVILGWVGLMWGQSAAASEAVMRFRMGQYEAALPLFQQAYRQTGDKLWASYLLECYLRLENYEAAERWLSQQKKSRSTPDIWLKVWEGRYLLAKGDSAGGLALWESTLKIPQADTHIYEDLAEVAARVWGSFEWERRFLYEARGRSRSPFAYAEALIPSLEAERAYAQAWIEWLHLWQGGRIPTDSLLSIAYRYHVQERVPLDSLEIPLLRLYQSTTPPPEYQTLLMRFYLLAEDYAEALRYARAVSRQTGQCEAIYEVGLAAEIASALQIAREAYQEIIRTYPNCPAYEKTIPHYLNVESLLEQPQKALARVDSLIRVQGARPALLIEAARWLLRTGQAQAVPALLDSLQPPTTGLLAQKYFLLADAALYMGDPVQARLYLLEVESRLPESAYLSTAYFKLAELAFFQGEFELARTRLRLLKNNTQDELSNDAIELYWLILDNLKPDTLTAPLLLLARALLAERQGNLSLAEELCDTLETQWKGHPVSDDVFWLRARLALGRGDTTKARSYLQLLADYPDTESLYRDEALYFLARLARGEAEAARYYERLLREVPNSLYARIAREALGALAR
jgi:tetratricopeptide (TPR) repeat protein